MRVEIGQVPLVEAVHIALAALAICATEEPLTVTYLDIDGKETKVVDTFTGDVE